MGFWCPAQQRTFDDLDDCGRDCVGSVCKGVPERSLYAQIGKVSAERDQARAKLELVEKQRDAWRKAAELMAEFEDAYGPITEISEYEEVLEAARELMGEE